MADAGPNVPTGRLSRLQNRIALAAAIGLIGGLAVLPILRVVDAHPDKRLFIGLCVAAAVLAQLVRETAAEPERLEPAPAQLPPGRSEYFARLRQLERRLEAASRDGSKYDRNVRPLLARLAADRLRQKYGIDAGRQPVRAKEVLGDQLWSLMVEPPAQGSAAPSQAQLSALVAAIEAL